MQYILEIVLPVGKVYLIIVAGFVAVLTFPVLKRAVPALLAVTLNVLLPLYFIHSLSAGWDRAVGSGWYWMIIFFTACVVMTVIQFFLGKLVLFTSGIREKETGRVILLLSAFHNAGYIPLPIIAALASKNVLVYMYFYFMAFNLMLWSISVAVLSGRSGSRVPVRSVLNGPILGIFAGTAVALLGWYSNVPRGIQMSVEFGAGISLPVILVLVGAIIASIPREDISFRKEFFWLILIKMVCYPGVMILLARLIPMNGLEPSLASGIRLALVLEAAVPPATNAILAAKRYGSEKHVRVVGGDVVYTYIASVLTLPLFLVISSLVYK